MKLPVAVLIPCFNSGRYLKATIESALTQTYTPLEVIAINDGSRDETHTILQSYAPTIRILSHPDNANLGQAASLNLGVRSTTAEFIAFLDSDDIWYPDKIEKQVKILKMHADIGLVYANGLAIDEEGKTLYGLFPDFFQERNVEGAILLNCYIRVPSSIMVRKTILEKAGLFRTDLQATDHDMWIRMSELTKFHYLPEILMAYRVHPGQQSLRRRQWEDGFSILREACQRHPYGVDLRRKRLAVLYYRLGEYDWDHGLHLRALCYFLLAGLIDPLRAVQVLFGLIKDAK
ncbi:MAG: glycosyltransferase [Nitrospiraceae bacterium]